MFIINSIGLLSDTIPWKSRSKGGFTPKIVWLLIGLYYIYGKKRLREIDRRVRYLSKRLESAVVVKDPPSDPNKIYFGAWVTLEDEDGNEHTFRIVGPDEIGESEGLISMDAPLGRSLFGKQVNDEVRVRAPSGVTLYWVTDIRYTDS